MFVERIDIFEFKVTLGTPEFRLVKDISDEDNESVEDTLLELFSAAINSLTEFSERKEQ